MTSMHDDNAYSPVNTSESGVDGTQEAPYKDLVLLCLIFSSFVAAYFGFVLCCFRSRWFQRQITRQREFDLNKRLKEKEEIIRRKLPTRKFTSKEGADCSNQLEDVDLEGGEGKEHTVQDPSATKTSAKGAATTAPPASDKLEDESEDNWNLSSPCCPICLGGFEEGEMVCYSANPGCCHEFHLDCMAAWLSKNDICPMCREPYMVDPSTALSKESTPPSTPSSTPPSSPSSSLPSPA